MKRRKSDLMKTLKERLKEDDLLIGTWCLIPSIHTINILANSGLDFLMLDMEHGPLDFNSVSQMIIAAETKSEVIVRVPNREEIYIQYALDSGATGVLVPHVENTGQINQILSYTKYKPLGMRGFSPFTKAGGYNNSLVDLESKNNQLLTGIMLETKTALQNLDEMLETKYVDVFYVGTYDLSVDFGVPGQVNNQLIKNALIDVIKKSTDKGKTVACMANNLKEANELVKLGVKFLLYKVDTTMLSESASEVLSKLKH